MTLCYITSLVKLYFTFLSLSERTTWDVFTAVHTLWNSFFVRFPADHNSVKCCHEISLASWRVAFNKISRSCNFVKWCFCKKQRAVSYHERDFNNLGWNVRLRVRGLRKWREILKKFSKPQQQIIFLKEIRTIQLINYNHQCNSIIIQQGHTI